MKIGVLKESKLLARHSMIYGLGILLNQAVALLLLPLYTRYLTVTDYGIKELISITMNVIGMLTTTAVSSAIFRFYFESDDARSKDEVIGTSILSLTFLGGLLCLAVYLGSNYLADWILDSRDLAFYFNIATASLWIQAVNGVGLDYLRANKKSLTFIVVSAISLLSHIALNIYFIVFLNKGVLGIFISTLLSSILMFGYLMVPIIIKSKLRFSLKRLREMLKFGLPMIPSSLGAFIVHSSDRFFIKAFCSIGDAGLYSLGYRFGILPGTFVSQPFNQVWMPRRLEVYKEPNAEQVFGKIFTYFLLLIVFAGLGISVLTREILKLIAAPEFWQAYQIVPIIVLANIVFTMHYHFNMGIVISKKTHYFALINFSNGILVLGLNTILIKYFGIYGAAYATLIAFIYKVALTYYFSNRLYKIHFEIGRIAKIGLSAAILFAVCQIIQIGNPIWSGAAKTAIILTYPVLLYLLRFYSQPELDKALHVVRTRLPFKKNQPSGTL